MSVNIRLDVPALERLIGGDTEIEVELRKGVVEAFAKHHLTAVLKDEAFARYLSQERETLRTALNALIAEHIGTMKREPYGTFGHHDVVYLTDEMKTALGVEAEKRISEIVRKKVDEVWARREQKIVGEIYTRIAEKVDRLTESVIQEQVKDRLAKVAASLKGA